MGLCFLKWSLLSIFDFQFNLSKLNFCDYLGLGSIVIVEKRRQTETVEVTSNGPYHIIYRFIQNTRM